MMRSDRIRRYVDGHFKRQGGRCCFCNGTMVRSHKQENERIPHNRATLEHIIPKMKGGGTTWTNTACSCSTCNKYRGPIPFEQFKQEKLWLVCNNGRRKALTAEVLQGR